MSSPKSLKRSYDDAGMDLQVPSQPSAPTSEQTTQLEVSSTQASIPSQSQTLPSGSDSTAENILAVPDSHLPIAQSPKSQSAVTAPEASKKRPRQTDAEKEAKRLDIESKRRERTEQKLKREEEKAQKDKEKAKKIEEKQIKDVEREEKRQVREEQHKLKEEERQRKEDEKKKKEKSQLRLNAFFARPMPANDGTIGLPSRESASPPRCVSRRSSVDSAIGFDAGSKGGSNTTTPRKTQKSEYEKAFPSFFVHVYTTVAPVNRFIGSQEAHAHAQRRIDDSFDKEERSSQSQCHQFDMQNLLRISQPKRRKIFQEQSSVKDIIAKLNSSPQYPIDLTNPTPDTLQTPIEMLRTVSTRYLKFAEDIRPPYIGTYTKVQDTRQATKIRRNPFTKGLPNTDYDYDSEAEWEEPGEGEDLDSEGEEENESEDDEEMDDFLDDEDAGDGAREPGRRRAIVGDLEPINSGLCWEQDYSLDSSGAPTGSSKDDKNKFSLAQFKLEVLLENMTLPLDPYSTKYWTPAITTTKSTTLPSSSFTSPSRSSSSSSFLKPPRIPLNIINRNHILVPNTASSSTITTIKGYPPPHQAPPSSTRTAVVAGKRTIPPDMMNDFKQAIHGSDLTKAGLIEILKKQFPTQSKDTIKETLVAVAERVGLRERDKRWVVRG